jgi:Protein of unknown function (DUF3107)
VDLRIGVTYSPREIDLQLDDDTDRDALHKQVEEVLTGDGVLWLVDRNGREVGVPSKKIAFVEIGSERENRSFGFSS